MQILQHVKDNIEKYRIYKGVNKIDVMLRSDYN